MGLAVICGTRHDMHQRILRIAAANQPVLIVDCATCADPHTLVRYATPEALDQIYVIEVDLLYKFRDVLLQLEQLAKSVGAKKILISAFDRLFHYQDEEENGDVHEQIWLLLRRIAAAHDIVVAVRKGTVHEGFARRFAGVIYGTHGAQPAASRRPAAAGAS
jgi:hypothetical protein